MIASHSGHVICTNLENGNENWRLKLSDRIESSATASHCGQFVCLGKTVSLLFTIVLHHLNNCLRGKINLKNIVIFFLCELFWLKF